MIEFNQKNIKRWMMKGTRNAYGAFLTEMAAFHPELFAITADFTKSSGLAKFKERYPNQFLSVGIAEQNMISLASGLASEGRNVFASCFASFATTRCYEQVKMNLGYMQHNVKLVGIASGLGVSHQGNTHFGLDDVSLMRAIPDMAVIVPSDCTEVAKATIALLDFEGPAYLRLAGEGFVPVVNEDDYVFEIGKGIKKRDGKDVLIVANGTMVSQALKVAKDLSDQGVECTVVNMHTVKPLDTQILLENIAEKKLVVTLEEGLLYGGLGSAIAEFLSSLDDSPKLLRLGICDMFPHAGSYQYLLEQCGLTVKQITDQILVNLSDFSSETITLNGNKCLISTDKCTHNMSDQIRRLEKQCYEMKLKALELAQSTSFGAHIGGGFSAMEIMATLYEIANIPSMKDASRDRIIISKGHGVLALYTALWKKGYITDDELATFETDGTQFYGHPHRNLDKGIEFSGGSLGLGLSYAVGVAKACKLKGLDNSVYVLLGDGEMDEGIIWESLMSISHFQLDNIVVILDKNGYQLDGPTAEIMGLSSIEKKLEAFGLDVEIVDGHSIIELLMALSKKTGKPRVIVANTIKAHGISFLENNKLSHQCVLSKKKYEMAVEEIKSAYNG
jgi:transketolase